MDDVEGPGKVDDRLDNEWGVVKGVAGWQMCGRVADGMAGDMKGGLVSSVEEEGVGEAGRKGMMDDGIKQGLNDWENWSSSIRTSTPTVPKRAASASCFAARVVRSRQGGQTRDAPGSS